MIDEARFYSAKSTDLSHGLAQPYSCPLLTSKHESHNPLAYKVYVYMIFAKGKHHPISNYFQLGNKEKCLSLSSQPP